MLQIKERAAIRDGCNDRPQLHRRHLYGFAEGAHAPNAPLRLWQGMVGVHTQCFTGNVVAGQFAQAELVFVVLQLVKSHLPAEHLKVRVHAFGQCVGQVRTVVATQGDGCVRCDQAFRQRSQSDRQLNRGAWFRTRPKRHLLVHHAQNAASLRVDRKRGTVVVAQRVYQRLADERVLAGGDVALGQAVRV